MWNRLKQPNYSQSPLLRPKSWNDKQAHQIVGLLNKYSWRYLLSRWGFDNKMEILCQKWNSSFSEYSLTNMYLYVFSTCPLFLSVLYSYNKSAMSYYLSYVKSATKIEENSTNADFYFLYFSQKQGEKSQDFVSSAHLTIPPTNYT